MIRFTSFDVVYEFKAVDGAEFISLEKAPLGSVRCIRGMLFYASSHGFRASGNPFKWGIPTTRWSFVSPTDREAFLQGFLKDLICT